MDESPCWFESSPGHQYKYVMRISDIVVLVEGPELKSTIASLGTILGSSINDLYLTLGKAAERNAERGLTLKQHHFTTGGVRTRWLDTFSSGLKGELHSLSRQIPGKTALALKEFLMTTPNKFKDFERVLPEILIKIGKNISNESLTSLGRNWQVRYQRYVQILNSLDWEEETATAHDPDKDKKLAAIKASAEKRITTSQQNTAADQMIAHVLNNVPQNIRHEIRTKIQKTPIENRLQVLAQLLQSKGIKI